MCLGSWDLRLNLLPLVGMAGAAPAGLVTGLQFKLGVAGAAIGEAVAKLRRAASARLLRMVDIEGILTCSGGCIILCVWYGCGRRGLEICFVEEEGLLSKMNPRWRYTIVRWK